MPFFTDSGDATGGSTATIVSLFETVRLSPDLATLPHQNPYPLDQGGVADVLIDNGARSGPARGIRVLLTKAKQRQPS